MANKLTTLPVDKDVADQARALAKDSGTNLQQVVTQIVKIGMACMKSDNHPVVALAEINAKSKKKR